MQYLVITVVQIEGDSVNDAAERALQFQADYGAEQFVHEFNSVNEAAVEAALVGATLAVTE